MSDATLDRKINSPKIARFLRLPEVIHRSGLPRTSLYREIASGSFPRSVAITERSRGWLESEFEAWMETRMRARRSDAR